MRVFRAQYRDRGGAKRLSANLEPQRGTEPVVALAGDTGAQSVLAVCLASQDGFHETSMDSAGRSPVAGSCGPSAASAASAGRNAALDAEKVAEAEGFEPSVPCGTAVFKTAAIGRSATPPVGRG